MRFFFHPSKWLFPNFSSYARGFTRLYAFVNQIIRGV